MKRLYKSRRDKVLDGVCAGIAEYFDVDPVLVRIIFVFLLIFGGTGVVAYIIGVIIMPRRPIGMAEESKYQAPNQQQAHPYEQQGEGTPPYNQPPDSGPSPYQQPEQGKSVEPAGAGKGALIVGIVLVAMGSLFLIDNLDIFRHLRVWSWFRHNFWEFIVPGIFILAGIALLTKSRDNSPKE